VAVGTPHERLARTEERPLGERGYAYI